MNKGKERHMFPGNNTGAGFFSYYGFIMPQQEANHIFCLKGGPGVGKSTFMRKIAGRLQSEGLRAEHLHCSSDPDSLDGVVFPELHVALIDGTSPHVIDPVNPGAVDEIVNLGAYWDLNGIKKNKTEIMKINAEVGKAFKTAYRYLEASACILQNITVLLNDCMRPACSWLEADRIVREEISKAALSENPGRVKKQFASAITPSGIVHFIETLTDETYTVYEIKNLWGIGVSELLKKISEEAYSRGLNTELYYCPMAPASRIEHLLIPDLKLAFLSRNRYYRFHVNAGREIDMTQYLDRGCVENNKEALLFSENMFQNLMDETIRTLHHAKRKHDEMEKYYIPHMNFEKINQTLEEIVERILKYPIE